jgi:hypothetical protein
VQDQPVVRVPAKGLRHDLLDLRFDLVDILARREAGAVADAEDMGVDCERLLAKRGVEHDVRGLSSNPWQRLKFFAGAGDLAAVFVDQRLAERDHIFGLGVEQADGLDCLAQLFLAKVEHLPWRFDACEERARGDVDARVRRLRGEHDRD